MFGNSGTGLSLKWLATVAVLILSGAAYAASNDADHQDIIGRIAPPGQVCLIGEPCAGAATVASASTAGGAQNPEQVYNTYCMACHATGANNSPIRGDVAAWEPRLERGMDDLYTNAINGYNNGAMPAKGLCMSCSDDDIRATVDYLLAPLQ